MPTTFKLFEIREFMIQFGCRWSSSMCYATWHTAVLYKILITLFPSFTKHSFPKNS